MRLERIKCKSFERAKNLCVSPSYIVGCTGQKAVILDRQLNPVHIVDSLDYVYFAQLSPDETQLLLVSTGNKFYIVDMHTYEKTRITVKSPYNHNLEGRGCWSFDGKSILLSVMRSTKYLNSTLRCYPISDLDKYQDYLPDKYCLTSISRIENSSTFFMTGYSRQENNRNYFIYFDGTAFQEYPLDASNHEIIYSADIDVQSSIVTLCTSAGCHRHTFDGKRICEIQHPAPIDKTLVFNSQKRILPDLIAKHKTSICGNYSYLASGSGFYMADAHTSEVLASVPEKYGVQNFEEITSDIIALATWNGVKLYQIVSN